MDQEQIKDALKGLASRERQEILDFLLYEIKQEKPVFSQREERVYEILGHHLGIHTPPLALFCRSYGIRKYRDKVAFLHQFFDRHCGLMRREPKEALIRVGLESLKNLLAAREIPITGGTILNSIHLMEDALDKAYPGYLRAKFLVKIIGRG